jgi:hypothetical protein
MLEAAEARKSTRTMQKTNHTPEEGEGGRESKEGAAGAKADAGAAAAEVREAVNEGSQHVHVTGRIVWKLGDPKPGRTQETNGARWYPLEGHTLTSSSKEAMVDVDKRQVCEREIERGTEGGRA